MAGIFTTFVMDILERTLPVEVTRPIIAEGYGPTPLLYRGAKYALAGATLSASAQA